MTAIDMLDEVAAAGAVLIKWLPPTHNIDPAAPRTIAFLSHAARIGIPLLIHMGAEAALGNAYPQFGDPTCWLNTFRQLWRNNNMPTVIAAHVATPLFWPITPGHTFHKLTQALTGEFAEVPLFADISALGQVSKAHWLKILLTMPLIQNKLVYGSDFPLPPMPVAFPFRLAGHYRQLHAFPSWIDRDIAIKASLGIDETVFLRSASLLAHRLNYAHHLVQEGLTSS